MKITWLVALCLLWPATSVGSETGVHTGSSIDFSSARALREAAGPCRFDGEPDGDAFNSLYDEQNDDIAPDQGIRRYAVSAAGLWRFGLEQKGRRLTPPIFDRMQPIDDRLLQVARGSCQGVIDVRGATVLPLAHASLGVDHINDDGSVVLVGGDPLGMQLIRIGTGDRPLVRRSGYYAYLSPYRGRSGGETYWYAPKADAGATGILASDLREVLPPRFDSIEFVDTASDGIDRCPASKPSQEQTAGRGAGLWIGFAKQRVELLSECGPHHAADGIAKVIELRAVTDGQPAALWRWNTLVALALDTKDDGCVFLTLDLRPFARAPHGLNGCRAAITGSGMLALPSEDGNTELFLFDARGEPRRVGRFEGRLYMQTQDFLVLQRARGYAVIDAAGRTPFGEDFQDAAPGCGAVPVSLRRGGLWYSLDINTRTLGKGTPGKPFFFSC